MTSFIRYSFLFVTLLLSSLVSHGAYVQMAGILLLCVYCLCWTNTRAMLLERTNVLRIVAALIVITACYLYFLLFPAPNGAPELEKSAFNNYVFLILVMCFVACLGTLIVKRLSELTIVLAALLVFNDLILFLQTALLLVSNTYIDFVQPVTDEASRYHNYADLNPVFAYRPTGLFVEPSTFSAVVASMAVGYILLSRARQQEPHALPIFLTLLAMLITQSTAAIVQCVVLLIVMVAQWRSARVITAVVCVVALVASPTLLHAYFNSFTLKMDATSAIRFQLLDFVYSSRTGWDWLLGYGPFTLENSLYHLANPDGGLQVASLNDAGLLQYFVVRFGIAGLLIPAWMFFRIRKDIAHVLLFGLVMSLKLSYAEPAVFFGLLPLLMRLPAHTYEATQAGSELTTASNHEPAVKPGT
jgi:hypothetical protein